MADLLPHPKTVRGRETLTDAKRKEEGAKGRCMTTRHPQGIPGVELSRAVPSPAKATAKRAPLPACADAPCFDWRPQPALRPTGDPNPRPERDSTSTRNPGPPNEACQPDDQSPTWVTATRNNRQVSSEIFGNLYTQY